MASTLIATHALENGLQLDISDDSRQIAEDRWLIRIRFTVSVPVAAHHAAVPTDNPPSLEAVVAAIGDAAVFEAVKARNFVSIDEKDAVHEAIVSDFLNDAAPYLGRPSFPGKLILKAYQDHLSRRQSV